jgi:hypothetical protein
MIEFFVITCDKYVHLMEDYVKFFNKYWDDRIFVTILGYMSPKCELPNNFIFYSLGDQNNFGNYWTNALIPYFNEVKCEFACILLDDIFFIRQTEIEKLFSIFDESEIEKKRFDKYILGALPNNMLIGSSQFTNSSLSLHKEMDYRTTLKPSIWRTEYFKKMLKPNYTAWDFETKNMQESKNDNSTVICHKMIDLTIQFNVYEKGCFNYRDYENKKHLICAADDELLNKYKK